MVLSIKSEKADQLARDLAELTGTSITDAVTASLEAQLERSVGAGVDRHWGTLWRGFVSCPYWTSVRLTRSSALASTVNPNERGRHLGDRRGPVR